MNEWVISQTSTQTFKLIVCHVEMLFIEWLLVLVVMGLDLSIV